MRNRFKKILQFASIFAAATTLSAFNKVDYR